MTTFPLTPLLRWDGENVHEDSDELAVEEPLEIRVRGRAISVTMRSGGNDEELAAGFLLSEGIIRGIGDIVRIEPCERNEFGNLINVVLSPGVAVDFERLTRHVFAASSCGLCGKASIEAIRGQFAAISGDLGLSISARLIATLPDVMRKEQSAFERTGGIHAAGLFDAAGKLVVLREDIGRHNAVDKVLGYALLKRMLPLDRHVLMVSGRASFEIMQKSLAGRIPIVAAVSAPSSLAVEFAMENRQTLIGFVREKRLNVYSGYERVRFE